MNGGGEGIGWTLALEVAPAALFGGAVAFSAGKLLDVAPTDVGVLACGAVGFAAALLGLRLFRGEEAQFSMPYFEQEPIEPEELAETPVVEDAGSEEAGELLLEDALPAPEPDSRVVRLFDPARMPTAGELQARIERHLRSPARPLPDATQELHDALAALRQSLR
jgi:hypothetical protein